MSKFSRNRLNSRCLSIEHLEPREMLHGGCHTVDVPIEGTFVIEECYSADCDVSCNLIIELSPSLENDRDKVDKAITLNGFMEDDFVYNTNQSDPDNEGRLIGINVGKHSIFGNIDFAGCDKLEVFNISDAADTEEITGINLSGCAILNDVVWGDDMSGLESLNISGTVLVSLDVSGFGGLTSLDVSNCLDLGGYPGILDFSGNKLFLSKADASGSLGVDLSVCFGTQTNAPIAEKLANGAAIDLSAEFKLLAGGTIKWFDEDGVPANGFFVDTEGKGVFTLTNCELGRAYYCVIDYYGDGFTVTETSSVTAVLATPVVTVGEVTDTTVALSWDPVEGADKYLLYGWCEIEEGHFVEYWAETEETSFVFGDMEDVELYPNTFYTFRVQVLVDEQPASEWSEDVTAATLALATPKVGWTATASTVTLTWNPVDDALSYVVEMSEDEGETWRPPTGGVGGSESFLATGLTAGTAYMFRVKAVGAGEAESTWCEVTATTTLGKLTRPVLEVDTEATTNKSITLTWEEVPYAAYYTLEWKLSSDNGQNPNWTEINNITGTTHTVDGLAANIRYHFRITAHAAGYNDSTASLVVGETTLANKLARPVLEVDTEATTNKSVTLTWEAVRGATYYTLEWKLSSDNSQNPTWYKIENVTGTSYTVDTLTANTRYHFRITAKADGFEDSTASLVVGETTLADKLTRPVLEVDMEATTNKSVTLTWEAVRGATYYTLEWKLSSDNSQNPTWYKIENVTGTSYTVDTLTANTRYHFRITAHAVGFEDSQASLVVGETTLANKLTRPVLDVDTEATTNKSVTLTWEAVRGATYYTLEWKLSSDNSQNPTWYKIENVTGASYTVGLLETLSANTRYHFRITAHADGFEDSQASLVVGETTKLNLV